MVRLGRRRSSSPSDRGLRTARLADEGWVLPWGLRRQVDHGSAAFVPRLRGEGLANRTGRRWTMVGPAGGPAAAVDPAGLVTPRLGGWSVDWWVGADDRWRLPSREPAVRQSLMGSTPVVETAMRVPGGDAVHRCYAVPGALVIEVENSSPAPFALALSIRPLDPLGATAVRSVAVSNREVLVDGRTALVLPATPGRVALSTGARGDVATSVLLGGEVGLWAAGRSCDDGLASAAVLLPVAHRATVRAVLPLAGADAPVEPLPSADAVVRGWQAQGRSGLGAGIPDPLVQGAFDAARLHLLAIDRDEPLPAEEAAVVVAGLGRLGRRAEADDLVRALWSRQRTDGSFDEPGAREAPGGPHLWALGEHLRLHPDAGLAAAVEPGLVAAEGWLRELEAAGPLPAPVHRWAIAGRRRAAVAAAAAGLEATAATLRTGAARAVAAGVPDIPTLPPQAGGHHVLGLATVGADGARAPLAGPAGHGVAARLASAADDISRGEAEGLAHLAWLLESGAPTWSWPDHVHPHTGVGSDGRGASPVACAGFLLVVRDLLVTESEEGHAAVLPVLPESWRGRPVEVRDAVLGGGTRLSFAVRWHGSRPALLWEASGALRLTAPGLDPSFSADERRGEALLEPAPSPSPAGNGTVELS